MASDNPFCLEVNIFMTSCLFVPLYSYKPWILSCLKEIKLFFNQLLQTGAWHMDNGQSYQLGNVLENQQMLFENKSIGRVVQWLGHALRRDITKTVSKNSQCSGIHGKFTRGRSACILFSVSSVCTYCLAYSPSAMEIRNCFCRNRRPDLQVV